MIREAIVKLTKKEDLTKKEMQISETILEEDLARLIKFGF